LFALARLDRSRMCRQKQNRAPELLNPSDEPGHRDSENQDAPQPQAATCACRPGRGEHMTYACMCAAGGASGGTRRQPQGKGRQGCWGPSSVGPTRRSSCRSPDGRYEHAPAGLEIQTHHRPCAIILTFSCPRKAIAEDDDSDLDRRSACGSCNFLTALFSCTEQLPEKTICRRSIRQGPELRRPSCFAVGLLPSGSGLICGVGDYSTDRVSIGRKWNH